jgi:hypothetical protein
VGGSHSVLGGVGGGRGGARGGGAGGGGGGGGGNRSERGGALLGGGATGGGGEGGAGGGRGNAHGLVVGGLDAENPVEKGYGDAGGLAVELANSGGARCETSKGGDRRGEGRAMT